PQVSGVAHCCTVEERRAPAAEDIGARRRRWTGDLTDRAGMGGMMEPPNMCEQRNSSSPSALREHPRRHPLRTGRRLRGLAFVLLALGATNRIVSAQETKADDMAT